MRFFYVLWELEILLHLWSIGTDRLTFRSSLTKQQEASLEPCQAVCRRAILQESYVSYSAALCRLSTLAFRRQDRGLKFSLNIINHEQNKLLFPVNLNLDNYIDIRNIESFKLFFAHTNSVPCPSASGC